MPQIQVIDPWGMGYQISSRNRRTLEAWFDEILPVVNACLDERDVPPAQINVGPRFWGKDADWLADTRVLGRLHPFPARNGAEGIVALDALREELAAELASIKAERGH